MSETQYIYLAQSASWELKIGTSVNPTSRVPSIPYTNQLNPESLQDDRRMFLIRVSRGGWLEERELHSRLERFRIPGTKEWYTNIPDVQRIVHEFMDAPVPFCPVPKPKAEIHTNVRIELSAEQAERVRGGCDTLTLTFEEARSLRASINAQLRQNHKGGRPPGAKDKQPRKKRTQETK